MCLHQSQLFTGVQSYKEKWIRYKQFDPTFDWLMIKFLYDSVIRY